MTRPSDILIVGAGIVGAAIAYELARRGASVTVVDARRPGQGASRASAGVLAPYIEGHEEGTLLEMGRRSLALYDAFVRDVNEDARADLEVDRSGTLTVAFTSDEVVELERTAEALAGKDVTHEIVSRQELSVLEPRLSDGALLGLALPEHAYVRVPALTAAVARAAAHHGARIEEGVSVTGVRSDRSGVTVATTAGPRRTSSVVVAAGSWAGKIAIEGAPRVPVRPVRGQLVYLRSPGRVVRRTLWSRRCYVVPWSDGTMLVGATVEEAGFDESATVAGVRGLLDAAAELLPGIGDCRFDEVRVGLRPGTPDDLPVIGRMAPASDVVLAAGHFRNGVLLAPLTAKLVADLILEGREDPVLAALGAGRFA